MSRGNDNGLLLEPNLTRVSACLIVRNNAGTIRPCIVSIRPWVDEIVVIDTGSTDGTDRICAELGARVFYWPWQDSFAAARNVSLDHARGEWIFWMDSDDTIPPECGQALRNLADGDHAENVLGWVMQVHCPGDDPTDLTVVDHVKLFRNRPDLRFELRMHEQILPAIRRAGGDVVFTEIYVIHSGSDRTAEGRARKLERDFKLLKLDLAENPDHPFVLFNLGMTYADDDQHGLAIEYLIRCVNVSQPGESHLRKAYALLVSSFSKARRQSDAWCTCAKGLELFPDDKELQFRKAMLQHEAGWLDDAAATYRRVLEQKTERYFMSVDVGIAGIKARHNLAIVYQDQGNFAAAKSEWRTIVAEHPDYGSAWRRLGQLLLMDADLSGAQTLLDELRQRPALDAESRLLAAHVAERLEDLGAARRELEEALRETPEDTELLDDLCRLLFEHGQRDEAELVVQRLLALRPDDPAAWQNLGSLREQRNDLRGAAEAYESSLRLRPLSATTMTALSRVLSRQQAS